MYSRKTSLRNGAGLFAVAVASLSLSAPAMGQSTVSTDKASTADADSKSDKGQGDIVVTGSRIARPELQSAMPVSVTNMDDALALGSVSISDALAYDPSIGNGTDLTTDATSQDAGLQAVNLRNLGTNRSLVLIDGQRRVSASATSSAVDLGMIPVGMVDRVEVVTGGAAAIYGADAVTGAVNVVTKRNVKGFNVSATTGISEQGDAGQTLVSFSTGAKFAGGRGSFALGGTYSHSSPLYYTDRFDPHYQLYYATNPKNKGPNDGVPDKIRINNVSQIYYDYRPTYNLNGQSYVLENGVPRPAVYDTTFSSGEFSLGDGGDGRTLKDTDMFRARQDSLALMGRYDFDVTSSIRYGGYFSFASQQYNGGEATIAITATTAGRYGSMGQGEASPISTIPIFRPRSRP